jgi:hypothetical protein
MNAITFIYVFILFYILSPGVLITLPKKISKIVAALIHGLIFTIILAITYRSVYKFSTNFFEHFSGNESVLVYDPEYSAYVTPATEETQEASTQQDVVQQQGTNESENQNQNYNFYNVGSSGLSSPSPYDQTTSGGQLLDPTIPGNESAMQQAFGPSYNSMFGTSYNPNFGPSSTNGSSSSMTSNGDIPSNLLESEKL